MKFQKALGIAICHLRKKKQFTQESLTILFASRSYLSEVENGKSEPSLSKVIQIAQNINIHPLTILTQAFLNADARLNIEDLHKKVLLELNANSSDEK